ILIRQTDVDVDVPFVGGASDPTADALRQDQVAPYSPPTVTDVRGALTIAETLPSADRTLTVTVDAPADAEAMQLSDTPTFIGAEWGPVADQADVTVGGIGYRNVFVRFQLPDGSTTQTSVVGGEIDPTIEAATASAGGAPHQTSWVRPFSSTEVALRIEAGRIEAGALEPYDLDNPQPGDDIDSRGGLPVVRRNGETYGLGVSARRDVIRRPDQLIGRPLDVGEVTGGGWTITSTDDPAYGSGLAPVSIRHLARPSDGGFDGDIDRIWALVHDLVIVVPEPLQPGASYQVTAPGVATATLSYDPATNVSPAVRVNQAGFAPDDQAKVAHLSGWYDGIGVTATADTAPGFQVVDADTGASVLSGTGQLRSAGNELGQGDLTGAPVVELDFTGLDQPGTYRVCVDDIGCSHTFEVDANIWTDLAATVARAVYHQRSGVQLGPPYTSFVRPRPYHPDDGVQVVASAYTLLEAQTETENTNFERLTELRTDLVVDEAWGGHFDAGDWDRRIQHLWFARHTAQLVMLYPEQFQEFDLNIPESGDAVPDLLDEALWTVDLFRRMQTDDGAIRGGIEASEHPPSNAASWVDDLAVLAYDPDPYSSYVYAGVAAEMSVALRPYDAARADELLASAERAMAWAEQQAPFVGEAGRVTEQRPVAAAALLFATGDRQWHDRFIETAGFLTDPEPHLSCHSHSACDAAWLYVQADPSVTDPAVREQLEARFLASADAIVGVGQQTAYGWTLENPGVPLIWGLGAGGNPKVSGLLRAYVLSGDETYRAAAVRSASVTLGSNPLGQVMLTGVGSEPVRHPQINDIKFGGLPAWPGTPVYGFHTLNALADEQWVVDDLLGPAGISPAPTELPYLWQWYDVDSIAQYNEFTLHQSHAEALLAFGLLAATS
ncbi:MAG: glycoside hydrolase family 9 protein, partial [Actinomycetota bacterium]